MFLYAIHYFVLAISFCVVHVFVLLSQQLFVESIQNGTMEGFYRLISYFQTQSEPAYCGLASLAMVLNALAIDPGRKWKGIHMLTIFYYYFYSFSFC